MTGEIERLKREETQAAVEKKRAAESLMEQVHRSNAEQVSRQCCAYYHSTHYHMQNQDLPCLWLSTTLNTAMPSDRR